MKQKDAKRKRAERSRKKERLEKYAELLLKKMAMRAYRERKKEKGRNQLAIHNPKLTASAKERMAKKKNTERKKEQREIEKQAKTKKKMKVVNTQKWRLRIQLHGNASHSSTEKAYQKAYTCRQTE